MLRSKEQLVAIRPHKDGNLLMMETMIFADEVVPTDELEGCRSPRSSRRRTAS